VYGVKVLDFGLAKSTSDLEREGETIEATREGMILGTAAYMSPEQARAQFVDKRTDIWAFGCVFYEMLTRRAPFGGTTIADTLAAILEREPDWSALPESTPSDIRRLLQRCLDKDPKRRLHDIADARIEIEDTLSAQTRGTRGGGVGAGGRTRERAAWIAAGVSTLALLALAGSVLRRAAGPERAFTYSILPPDGTSFVAASPPALSPNGHLIAFVAKSADDQLLWVRSLDAFDARPLPGTEGAVSPFWSPDSGSLGFFAQGSLKTIALTGGRPRILAGFNKRLPIGTWNREDKILFEPVTNNLAVVSASGGGQAAATELDQALQEENHLGPSFLPDGQHYLLLIRGGLELELQVWVGELGSNQRRLLLRGVTNARYAPARGGSPGRLLYVRERSLIAQPFDEHTMTLTGNPMTVAERVAQLSSDRVGDFSVSPAGVLAYRVGDAGTSEMMWFDRRGKAISAIGDRPGNTRNNLRLSPDGKSVAFTRQGAEFQDVWIYDLVRGVASPFTLGGGRSPVWSPDGSQIAFLRQDTIYRKLVSGAGAEVALWHGQGILSVNDWSGDGLHLLFTRWDTKNGRGLWLLSAPLSDSRDREPSLIEPGALHGQFVPANGAPRWISYDTAGREVFVRTMPGDSPGRWQVSIQGGNAARSRRDGRELYFAGGGPSFVAMQVESGPPFRAGALQRLFALTGAFATAIGQYAPGYDVTADGQRFLSTFPSPETPAPSITVVINWQSAFVR
jgi:Tol biopolymer transport system component